MKLDCAATRSIDTVLDSYSILLVNMPLIRDFVELILDCYRFAEPERVGHLQLTLCYVAYTHSCSFPDHPSPLCEEQEQQR